MGPIPWPALLSLSFPGKSTILKSMSSDILRINLCARAREVPPPKTNENGAASIAARARIAATTYKSFSTSAGLVSPKCVWASRILWRVSALNSELRVAELELAREVALHAESWIDRHLG